MELDGPKWNELGSREKAPQVRTTLLLTRLVESIIEWFKPSVFERSDTLTDSFVQDVYTVPTTVSTRNTGGLTVKPHTEPTEITELAHRILNTEVAAGRDGDSALNTPVSGRTTRSKTRSL